MACSQCYLPVMLQLLELEGDRRIDTHAGMSMCAALGRQDKGASRADRQLLYHLIWRQTSVALVAQSVVASVSYTT